MIDPQTYDVLVIGAGISGMQSALDLAEKGLQVLVVDRQASIGGTMVRLDKTFPTNDCAICIAAPKMVELARHPNISLLTGTQVEAVSGSAGNFQVALWQQTGHVDPEKCTGCGDCASVCPVEVPDEFNLGLSQRKAVYLQFPQAVPAVYTIDDARCTGCGACDRACGPRAISFLQRSRTVNARVSSIVVATGFSMLEPQELRKEYGYGRFPNVVTALQYERLLSASGPTSGAVVRPSDGLPPERLAWIQCVGSRSTHKGNPYCSKICCMYATKEAVITIEHHPHLRPTIFYMDLRAYGKDFQQYYQRAAAHGVRYVRSRPAAVAENPDHSLTVSYVDTLTGTLHDEVFDLLVLSTAVIPSSDNRRLAHALDIAVDAHGFFVPRDSLLDPLQATRAGIFLAGGAQGPNDIPDCVAQASGAAGRAVFWITNGAKDSANNANAKSANGTKAANTNANGTKAPPSTVAATTSSAFVGNTSPAAEKTSRGAEKTSAVPEKTSPTPATRTGVFVCSCGKNIGGFVDVATVTAAARELPGVACAERFTFACSEDTQRRITAAIAEHGLDRVVVAACSPITHGPVFQETCAAAGLNPALFEMANIRNQCSWVHSTDPGPATAKAHDLVRMAVARAGYQAPLQSQTIPVTPNGLVIGGGVAGMTAAVTLADMGLETYLIEREPRLGGKLNHLNRLFPSDTSAAEAREHLAREVARRPRIKVFLNSELQTVAGHIGNFQVTVSDRTGGSPTSLQVGAMIVATGFEEVDLTGRYGYGAHPQVITQLELERRLRDGTLGTPRRVVMLNCAGSLDAANPACCRVGCGVSVKNARLLRQALPEAQVSILYQDLRVFGREQEEYFTQMVEEVRPFRVRYDAAHPPTVAVRHGQLVVTVYDTLLREELALPADLVVLTAALRGDHQTPRLRQLLKVPTGPQDFYTEAHAKIRPLDFATDGIYLCGADHYPRSIPDTIAQAEGAASRAAIPLLRGQVNGEPIVATVDPARCAGCGLCANLCPYAAVTLDLTNGLAAVAEVLCKGCGTCVAACPSGALQQRGFTDEQLLAMVATAWE